MHHLDLIRYNDTGSETLGIVYLNSTFMCYSLEPPWGYNKVNVSCIPTGTYIAQWIKSRDKYRLTHVDGRAGIYIHEGNVVFDTKGSILLGASVNGNMIQDSKQTITDFHVFMKEKPFTISIKDINV